MSEGPLWQKTLFFQTSQARIHPFDINLSEKGFKFSPKGYAPENNLSTSPANYPPNLAYFPEGEYNLQGKIGDKPYVLRVNNPAPDPSTEPSASFEISTAMRREKQSHTTTWRMEQTMSGGAILTKIIAKTNPKQTTDFIEIKFDGKVTGISLEFLGRGQSQSDEPETRKSFYILAPEGDDLICVDENNEAVPNIPPFTQAKALSFIQETVDLSKYKSVETPAFFAIRNNLGIPPINTVDQ